MNAPNVEITNKKLDLPPVNNLIAKNYDVLPKSAPPAKVPQVIKQWEDSDLWYMKDDKFETPKAVVYMKLYTNDNRFGETPRDRLFPIIWRDVFDEFIGEFAYMAEVANLNSSVVMNNDNIQFKWEGFNDSMPNYIAESL
jgi:secreted Zn-dependent insulinase-like peptidase